MPPIALLLLIVAAIVGQVLWERSLLRVDGEAPPDVWRQGVVLGLAITAVIGLGALLVATLVTLAA